MARLNDPPCVPNETLENLKKRYIRQNREIARANSQQSVRIRTLEAEAHFLLHENLSLREEIVRLKTELKRRDNAVDVLDNVSATKSVLEAKLREMAQLLGTMKTTIEREKLQSPPTQEKRERQVPKPYVLAPGQEGLPSIAEDQVHPRRSLGLDDVPILAPVSTSPVEDPESEDDEDMIMSPPVTAYLDMRPRRRRDSSTITELPTRKPVPVSTPNSRPTQRFEEGDISPEAVKSSIDDEVFQFRIIERSLNRKEGLGNVDPVKPSANLKPEAEPRLSFGASSVTRINQVEQHVSRLAKDSGALQASIAEADPKLAGAKETTSKPKKSVLKMSSYPLSETTAIEKVQFAERKPLGAKTVNTSPQKCADTSMKLKPLREIKDNVPPPVMSTLDRPLPSFLTGEMAPNEDHESGRSSRRARASVNYALPNLKDKMRREATEEPNKRKRTSNAITKRDSTADLEVKLPKVSVVEDEANLRRISLDSEKENNYRSTPTEDILMEIDEVAPPPPTSYHRGKRRVSSLHSSLISGEMNKRHDAGTSGRDENYDAVKHRAHESDGMNTGLNGPTDDVFTGFNMLSSNITISKRRASHIGTSKGTFDREREGNREYRREQDDEYYSRAKSRRKTMMT